MVSMTASWGLSLACMVIGTAMAAPVWRAWGIWFALVACCWTGWGIVDYVVRKQRLRMEDLARIMAAEASDYYREQPTLTSVR